MSLTAAPHPPDSCTVVMYKGDVCVFGTMAAKTKRLL